MKWLIAATIGLVGSYAHAEPAQKEVYGKRIIAQMAESFCQGVTSSYSNDTLVASKSEGLVESSRGLHSCQFFTEINDSGCLEVGSCPTYDEWTRDNPDISPELPREVFLAALALHAEKRENSSSCDKYLSLSDLKSDAEAVSSASFQGRLCVRADQFSKVVVGDSSDWRITPLSKKYFVMTPSKPIGSLAVLFEPGQSTGHAVLLYGTPAVAPGPAAEAGSQTE